MVLESTMICLDNSDYMRNGDYNPTRLEAQQDAAGLLCNDRTRNNPENTVGVLTMAGKGVELLVSPTEDIGKILACFAKIRVGGSASFGISVQVAQLALKHRKNKNGGQRIIVFVGSPISEELPALLQLGKQLKKNNVAIDVVSMGELEDNTEKLSEFIKAASSSDNSRLITVPPGVLPLDAINASQLVSSGTYGSGSLGGGNAGAGGGGGAFEEYGGVDPEADPELAMALRVSTEEARAREEARAAEQSRGTAAAAPAAETQASSFGGAGAVDEDDEEALMRQALELSMMEISSQSSSSAASSSSSAAPQASLSDADALASAARSAAVGDEDEEEAALRIALELSMQTDEPSAAPVPAAAPVAAPAASAASEDLGFLDTSFVSELLGSVDVDLNDPLIQAALSQLGSGSGAGGSSSGTGSGNAGDECGNNSKKRKGPDSEA